MSEAELPAAMEQYGFREVRTGYAVSDLTPDDPTADPELAREIILSGKYNDLEALDSAARTLGDKLDAAEPDAVKRRIEEKYDQRLAQYAAGEKQWETVVSLLMILRGVKA